MNITKHVDKRQFNSLNMAVAIWLAILSVASVGYSQVLSSVLVVGAGFAYPDHLSQFESWNVTTSRHCGRIADYPIGVAGAIGAFLDNHITVCGGQAPNGVPDDNKCFFLDYFNGFWVEMAQLPRELSFGSSVIFPNGDWWITGQEARTASLIWTPEGGWTDGPVLPEVMSVPCMIMLNEKEVFFSHGRSFVYNLETEEFIQVATAAEEYESYLSCIELNDGRILMAGDYKNFTQIYDPSNDSWIAGPALEIGYNGPRLLWYDDRILLMGGLSADGSGYSNVLYELVDDTWVEMEFALDEPRTSFVALSVPAYAVPECP